MILGINGVGISCLLDTVQHVIYTNLIDPDMKWRIDKFDEEL